MSERAVVVTGVGVVTPIGIGMAAFAGGLAEGRCGIGPIRRFDASHLPVTIAAEIHGFSPAAEDALYDRAIQYALAAAREALADAGPGPEPEQVAVVMGVSKGGMMTAEAACDALADGGPRAVGPGTLENMVPLGPASVLASVLNARGPCLAISAACSSSTHAILIGADLIRQGRAKRVLVGGADAAVTPAMLAAYTNLGAISATTVRPFDRRRDGFAVGEGAAVLVLDAPELVRPGQRVWGHILGGIMATDPYHATAVEPGGRRLAECLTQALADANLAPGDIDYINCHGTATKTGDPYEVKNLQQAFGDDLPPASSTKSMTGHLFGAAGAVEAAACLAAMDGGFLPPTLHCDEPDPSCHMDIVPFTARPARVNTACSVSLGFGGTIGALILGATLQKEA